MTSLLSSFSSLEEIIFPSKGGQFYFTIYTFVPPVPQESLSLLSPFSPSRQAILSGYFEKISFSFDLMHGRAYNMASMAAVRLRPAVRLVQRGETLGISNKTRKLLWGRSGNRCAICKRELVIDASSFDEESVVGEECHIVSGKVGGPRYDPSFPSDQIDTYNNLILLCRVHHKMVDDQPETYTADILRQMKANHEKWVSKKLRDANGPNPMRLRKVKNGAPDFLTRVTSGKEILNVVDGACVYAFDHDELRNQGEVDLVGGFLQVVQDWGELRPLEAYDKVRIGFELTELLQELEDAGFLVFGGREVRVLEGGIGEPSVWPIAIIRVLRKTNKEIIRMSLANGVEGSNEVVKRDDGHKTNE